MAVNLVKTLRFYCRIYLMIVSQYIKARLQYRADFVISSVGLVLANGAAMFSFWVIFQSIDNLAGYSLDEMIFMYALAVLAQLPLDICFSNIASLPTQLISGSFITYYFRPLNTMFYFVSSVLNIKGFSQLFIGIGALAIASIRLEIEWNLMRILLLPVILMSGTLVMISFTIMAAAVGFWVRNSEILLEFLNALWEFADYPLTIFNSWIRMFFTLVVPVGFIAFYPAQFFFENQPTQIWIYFSPFLGFALFGLAYLVWHKGTLAYSGTGT